MHTFENTTIAGLAPGIDLIAPLTLTHAFDVAVASTACTLNPQDPVGAHATKEEHRAHTHTWVTAEVCVLPLFPAHIDYKFEP